MYKTFYSFCFLPVVLFSSQAGVFAASLFLDLDEENAQAEEFFQIMEEKTPWIQDMYLEAVEQPLASQEIEMQILEAEYEEEGLFFSEESQEKQRETFYFRKEVDYEMAQKKEEEDFFLNPEPSPKKRSSPSSEKTDTHPRSIGLRPKVVESKPSLSLPAQELTSEEAKEKEFSEVQEKKLKKRSAIKKKEAAKSVVKKD